jgi:hypothetical protein
MRLMTNPAAIDETAFQFRAAAPVQFAADDGAEGKGRKRRLSGVAYSGEVIAPHWYWGAVVFDLATCEIPDRIPVLVDHNRSERAGVTSMTAANNRLDLVDGVLLDNETGNEIAADADAGFPFQLSVHIEPANVQTLQPNESATVNGRVVNGPCAIFRNSQIREVSLTPTGADSRTSATVFAASPITANRGTEMSNPNPNPNEFSAAAQARIAELEAQAAASAARVAELETQAREFAARARTEEVRNLFAEIGREFNDQAASAYLALSPEQFAAIAADLRANAKPAAPAPDPTLFSHQATAGATVDTNDPKAIAAAAHEFQARERAAGRDPSYVEAVRAVTRKA